VGAGRATLIALANLANITGTYFFLVVGVDSASEAATIAVGCVWLAVTTWLGIRGLQVSSRVQVRRQLGGAWRVRSRRLAHTSDDDGSGRRRSRV
jgi:hypothetical protein